MTAWAERLPLIDRRLQWAVAASLVMHLLLMAVVNTPRHDVAPSADGPELVVSLRRPDPVPVVTPDPIVVSAPIPVPLAVTKPAPAVAPAEHPVRRKAALLNLAVPQAFLAEEDVPVVGSEGLEAVFDPQLRQQIERARATAHRSRAIDGRRSARDGVPPDDYARDTGAGLAVKTGSGCFVERQGQSLSTEPMWWRTKCSESRLSPWEQEQIDEANLHPTLRRR